ncbi:unnamed protein product, partial [Mesorhabditis belari]|uniref:RING-type domain-containing protein n=1 Tax=Mesorhabditis belari TaxID=2138241 RepID=A0AAF3F3A5_9BILA
MGRHEIMPASTMKIFKSLNCQLCNAPFVGLSPKPKSPRGLECGAVICKECFETEEGLKKDKKRHQCAASNCFNNANPAHFITDLLSNDALVLMPNFGGYLLVKAFKVPRCGICHEEYSATEKERIPYAMRCSHVMCTKCFMKNRKLNLGDARKQMYWIKCPICAALAKVTCLTGKSQLQAFLQELPDLVKQFDEMKASSDRFCDGCRKMNTVDGMAHCEKCKTQNCRPCQGIRHRSHESTPLVQKEMDDLFEEMRDPLNMQVRVYKEENLPALHQQINARVAQLNEMLHVKEANLKKVTTYSKAREDLNRYKAINAAFAQLANGYSRHTKEFEAQLVKLLNSS